MRFLCVCIFVASIAAVVYSVREIEGRGRPMDVIFGLVAPLAALLGVAALIGIFVPGFF